MTHDDTQLARLLAQLPAAVPDAARAARVKTRCHRVLARRVRPPAPRPVSPLEPVLVGGFCLFYLLVVIQQALH
jgi:hypothetical protein